MNFPTHDVFPPRRGKRRSTGRSRSAVACLFAVLAGGAVLTGCAPLLDAQSTLVVQARRGIEVAQSNRAGATSAVEQLSHLKRKRLDDAFDADVRAREGDLTPEWVIDARIAYAVALDMYAKEEQALRESDDVARQNLEAVDAALSRVQMLQSIQNRWLKLAQEEEQ